MLEKYTSRNAHLMYEAQINQNRVLTVDAQANLQRVSSLGKIFTFIADIVTNGHFSMKRAAQVNYVCQKTLQKVAQHLKSVVKKSKSLNELELREALNIPKPRFLGRPEVSEKVSMLDPAKLPQNVHLKKMMADLVRFKTYDEMVAKHGKVQKVSTSLRQIELQTKKIEKIAQGLAAKSF